MPGMPDLILRAPVFGRLTKASRVKGAHTSPLLDKLIKRLQGDPSLPENKLVKIAVDHGFYADAAQAEHVKKDWLNDPPGGGFWPSIDTESIIRKGLLTLCEQFKATGKPIEVFWVISGDQNTSRWEMSISVCRSIIVVMFHTPQFPCFVPTRQSNSMWIARLESNTAVSRPVLEPVPPAAPSGTGMPKKPKKAKKRKKRGRR